MFKLSKFIPEIKILPRDTSPRVGNIYYDSWDKGTFKIIGDKGEKWEIITTIKDIEYTNFPLEFYKSQLLKGLEDGRFEFVSYKQIK